MLRKFGYKENTIPFELFPKVHAGNLNLKNKSDPVVILVFEPTTLGQPNFYVVLLSSFN
jgi:hypothetical protein